jgi:hypothetical protein
MQNSVRSVGTGDEGAFGRTLAGIRARIAERPPQRIGDAGAQHMPGEEAWLDPHDRAKYRWRSLVERLFSKLKNWRRVAT